MKYKYFLILGAISLMAINAFGESEMDSEINDLQVKIVHVNPNSGRRQAQRQVRPKVYSYSARQTPKTSVIRPVNSNFYKPTVVARPTLVASNSAPIAPTVTTPAVTTPIYNAPETRHQVDDNNGTTNNYQAAAQANDQYQDQANEEVGPQGNVRSYSRPSSSSGQFIRRIELLPAFTMSSFDGGDSSLLQPSGVSNTYNSAPSISLLSDIDFGKANFFIESGLMVSQMGAGTGVANQNGFIPGNFSTISEKVALTYIGVPLNLKYRLRDQDTSSFFIKAGATPVYMASHAYTITGSSISEELRFGAYNTFDLLLGGGVGYDLKILKDFHAVVDISAFQGVFPVLTNYSVFNYGVNLGLGIAYTL